MKALLLPLLLAGMAQQWRVGVEREVYPGNYAKLLYRSGNWSEWQLQTANSKTCMALASRAGGMPTPSGYGLGFEGDTPYVQIQMLDGDPVVHWFISGAGLEEAVELREHGTRFFQPYRDEQDLSVYDGKIIDVHARSYKYPEIKVGVFDETATINLNGLTEMKRRLAECKSQP